MIAGSTCHFAFIDHHIFYSTVCVCVFIFLFRSKHMVSLAEALRKAELHKNDLELELQILEEAAEMVVEEEFEEQGKTGQEEQMKQCEDEEESSSSSSSSEEEEEYSSSEDHDSNGEEEEEQKGVPDGLAMTCPCSQELEHGESLIPKVGERLEEELRFREDVLQITVPSSSTVREGEVEGLRKTDDSQFPEAPDGIKIAKAASDTDLVEHRQYNIRILNTEELDSDDEDEDQQNE